MRLIRWRRHVGRAGYSAACGNIYGYVRLRRRHGRRHSTRHRNICLHELLLVVLLRVLLLVLLVLLLVLMLLMLLLVLMLLMLLMLLLVLLVLIVLMLIVLLLMHIVLLRRIRITSMLLRLEASAQLPAAKPAGIAVPQLPPVAAADLRIQHAVERLILVDERRVRAIPRLLHLLLRLLLRVCLVFWRDMPPPAFVGGILLMHGYMAWGRHLLLLLRDRPTLSTQIRRRRPDRRPRKRTILLLRPVPRRMHHDHLLLLLLLLLLLRPRTRARARRHRIRHARKHRKLVPPRGGDGREPKRLARDRRARDVEAVRRLLQVPPHDRLRGVGEQDGRTRDKTQNRSRRVLTSIFTARPPCTDALSNSSHAPFSSIRAVCAIFDCGARTGISASMTCRPKHRARVSIDRRSVFPSRGPP